MAEPDIPAAAATADLLARQLRIPRAQVEVAQVTSVNWPDSCLGLPAEGEICAMMITPGYAVRLNVGEQRYQFRTDESGRRIRLASAPAAEAAESLLTWRDTQSFSVLVAGTGKASFGVRGGPLLTVPLPSPERARELLSFVGSFAPISERTPAGEINLRSVGTTSASPSQKRMIAEWARLVRDEASNGLAASTADQVFVWKRSGGTAGECNEVIITRTGTVSARDCTGGKVEPLNRLTLESEELAQLYSWLDRFGSHTWMPDPGPDALMLTADFRSTGTEPLPEENADELLAFVNQIASRVLQQASSD